MKFLGATVIALFGAALSAIPADAKMTTLTIERIEPFAPGTEFGAAGAYEKVIGKAKGELDPDDPRNAVIVNLDKAPRNALGLVEYETDFYILRPADPAKGNRKIVYDVTNRGRKLGLIFILDAVTDPAGANDPKAPKDVGNALFLRQGWTIVWSGWDPDAPKTAAQTISYSDSVWSGWDPNWPKVGSGMAMTVPVATKDGQPIVRTIRDEFASGMRGQPVDRFFLSYQAATFDQSKAQLTMRRHRADRPLAILAGDWAYSGLDAIKLLPDGPTPEPGTLYDFRYPATNPKILGIGFAATRDLVSFLRYEARDQAGTANPAGAGIRNVLAIGISQSGRYLRDHIGLGFNQDEARRKVFDGVLTHISGIGRVFLNAEFGQPFRTNTQHEDHFFPENEFPFSTAAMHDPITGKTGALFRGDGFDPLLIEVNTSTEYWQKGASLLHTDPLGQKDAALPGNARVYLVAGTQHSGRAGLTPAPGPCFNPRNPHNAGPALRALFAALDAWVGLGAEPPPSRIPAIAGRSLVPANESGFPALPGVAVARATNSLALFGDWVNPEPDLEKRYRVLVPKVDADGNETAGIRLPDIAVPLGSYTGWNLYKGPFPEGALCDRDGSFIAFAKTKVEREAKGDPRQSLEERYGNHADYVAKVEAAVVELIGARLLLAEDGERFVAAAKAKNPLAP